MNHSLKVDYKIVNQNLLAQLQKTADECSINYSLAVVARAELSKLKQENEELKKEIKELKQNPTKK